MYFDMDACYLKPQNLSIKAPTPAYVPLYNQFGGASSLSF